MVKSLKPATVCAEAKADGALNLYAKGFDRRESAAASPSYPQLSLTGSVPLFNNFNFNWA